MRPARKMIKMQNRDFKSICWSDTSSQPFKIIQFPRYTNRSTLRYTFTKRAKRGITRMCWGSIIYCDLKHLILFLSGANPRMISPRNPLQLKEVHLLPLNRYLAFLVPEIMGSTWTLQCFLACTVDNSMHHCPWFPRFGPGSLTSVMSTLTSSRGFCWLSYSVWPIRMTLEIIWSPGSWMLSAERRGEVAEN